MLYDVSIGKFLVCPLFRYSTSVLSQFSVLLFSDIQPLSFLIILFARSFNISFPFTLITKIKLSANAWINIFLVHCFLSATSAISNRVVEAGSVFGGSRRMSALLFYPIFPIIKSIKQKQVNLSTCIIPKLTKNKLIKITLNKTMYKL